MPGDETNLSELILAIRRSLFKIILFAVVITSAVVGYTYINAPKWKVSSSLLIVMQDDMPQSANIGSLLGKESASPLGVLTGVLNSRRSFEYISGQTGLKVKELRDRLLIKDSPGASQLRMEITTNNIEQGKKVLRSATDILGQLDKEASFSTSVAQLKKLEELYKSQIAIVDELTKKVVVFQKTAKVINPTSLKQDSTTKVDPTANVFIQLRDVEFQLASTTRQLEELKAKTKQSVAGASGLEKEMPSLRKWRDKAKELEFELKVARSQYGDEYPDVIRLNREVKLANEELQAEISRQMSAVQNEVEPGIAQLAAKRSLLVFQQSYLKELVAKAPDEMKSLRELERELAAGEANLQQLRTQLQQARIKAAARLLQWRILDDPAPSEEPTNKDFKTRGAITFVVGLLLGVVWVAMRFLAKVKPSHAVG
jgi:uncharacterized protein involved in exopolysaccharide biosynthesis